jgi:hypothetical protein
MKAFGIGFLYLLSALEGARKPVLPALRRSRAARNESSELTTQSRSVLKKIVVAQGLPSGHNA